MGYLEPGRGAWGVAGGVSREEHANPAHLMRLFFIDSKFKCVPLEASYSRNIFAHCSPSLV
jgi:hypothetical protein